MKKVNLRDLYPDVYKTDAFLEVTDEVQAVFQSDERAEAAYRKMHPPGKTDGKECDLPQDPERRSMSQSVSLLELKISDKTKIQRWRLF